jgi:splicing factor 3A subunit 2
VIFYTKFVVSDPFPGSYECKLCLTLHRDEGSYLAHTQGKRHQTNLARRAAMQAKKMGMPDALAIVPVPSTKAKIVPRKAPRIGRPGYKVTKLRDPETGQKSLKFEILYPEIEENFQPRHKFMSAFEQRVEMPDKRYQYLLFAADPYETIAFKIPRDEIERDPTSGKYSYNWDKEQKIFTLHIFFKLLKEQIPPNE